ncbi:hypothetical protein JHK82_027869 [Glycine max]|uniref:Uncharacterized protein n=1 Tax=Glycine soja TaxID=3848 RepID=A0A445ILD6_GLYSO|nr:hypothetical protein JHK87_027774 [Glycine soja]KAG5127034.1 hypothetical protein JHK82_027869 [Glycine max]RZB86878.1 hypothetical protein D0Y65_026820 [Glycine soja]
MAEFWLSTLFHRPPLITLWFRDIIGIINILSEILVHEEQHRISWHELFMLIVVFNLEFILATSCLLYLLLR